MKVLFLHKPTTKALFFNGLILSCILLNSSYAAAESFAQQVDSPQVNLPYPISDSYNPFFWNQGLIDFQLPSNINSIVDYDPLSGQYNFQQTYGNFNFRPPSAMSFEDYQKFSMEKAVDDYWSEIISEQNSEEKEELIEAWAPQLKVDSEVFDKIFGGNTIDIRPQGSAELSFGINRSKTENPRIPERQRSITTPDFKQRIQLNLIGNIGDKLKISTNYNTEATFDFENEIKMEYNGYEDEIIQKIEAGNVSLPLGGSLITGSQSLFGLKTELKFGRLTATTLFSQEKGERKEINVEGGAQTQDFEITADSYEANKHYFLSQYFKDQYDKAMQSLPFVNSAISIVRIEVWITNTRANFEENRNFVAFTDLGEDAKYITPGLFITDQIPGNALPYNAQNSLYNQVANNANIRGFTGAAAELSGPGFNFAAATDYEELESARRLDPNEFTFNAQLGFISLNQSLNNDEVVAVAYQYTRNGETFQVGEFSTDGIEPPNALMLKLIKSTITNPRNALWELMMKNVYALGAYQVNREDFRLDLWYDDPLEGVDVPFIPREGVDAIPLMQLLALDRIDQNTNPNPDGVFDFVDNAATQGGTINSQNGRVYFTVVEPFGSYLDTVLAGYGVAKTVRDQIVYPQLYDSTKTAAQQIPELNRFTIKGTYKSASTDEIALNAINVPQGSVTVTAGGVQLTENVDYTVDYNLGRVKILNQGLLESQTPIKISLESNSLFSIQTKTLIGTRLDYRVDKNTNIGGTIMNLTERPLTQKINIGNEPISNTIWGLDGNYQTESNFITKLVDAIPFIESKEKSTVSFSGEFAHLIPGHSKAIGKAGESFIDDFEGSQSSIDIRNFTQWALASTPQGQDMFPEAQYIDSLVYGYNRAKLAWYVIDPLFFRNNNNNITLNGIDNDVRSDHRMREVLEQEVFPNRELRPGTPTNIPTLDLSYYPDERGPYNFNPELQLSIAEQAPRLEYPEESWGGIMRSLTTTDFEQANIEFIQFWMMDPFNSDADPDMNNPGGELYFNLGNISEDILRDSRKSFENGLPKNADDTAAETDTTTWAIVPATQSIVNAFDNTTNSNAAQDVGYDGVGNADELNFFADYISNLPGNVVPYVQNDPSADDFRYFRGNDAFENQQLNTLERYKEFNGTEGNSITAEDASAQFGVNFPMQSTTLPSTEDINQDQNLSKSESYFQYKVSLRPGNLNVGQNYITDRLIQVVNTPNGQSKPITWYQFKIPLRDLQADGAQRINNIQDFRSIRFIRMFLKNWDRDVTLRFARLELIRGEWRKYIETLAEPGENEGGEVGITTFDISAVNIEENGNRLPINYVLPPGVSREIDAGTANLRNLNEQSLAIEICHLEDGDARAAYRNVNIDMRSFKKLKMYAHIESSDENIYPLDYGDVTMFVRLGSDFNQNFYEYELPLQPTAWGDNQNEEVWPEVNNMEILFEDLQKIKTDRNLNNFPINMPYQIMVGGSRVTLKGNPVLSQVKTIMIGFRNPQFDQNPWNLNDDGLPKCFEAWVNELRLSDFDERGGWAAIARMNTQLADFGNLSVAANISTPGFGSIEKKVSERQRENIKGFDASSNLELGKFLPEKTGIKVPMFVSYSETVSTPQFDPLSPDLETTDVLEDASKSEKRKRQNFTKRRSINFTNVRKERGKDAKGQHVWDVENFSFSYGYNEVFTRDINTEYNHLKNYNGGMSYNFSPKPLEVNPFKGIGKSKWLKLVKDFNFNLGPKQFSFRTDVNRSYHQTLSRNNTEGFTFIPPPQYTKTFNWNRVYSLNYDITKSLKFDFNANNRALIGEPDGRVDKDYKDEYEVYKDSIWASIRDFGQTTNYSHSANLSYKLPLDKFPLTDWITVNGRYGGTYDWARAPFSQDSLGHTIQNSRNISLNGQLNMLTLYNKVPFLKKVNQTSKRPTKARGGRNTDPKAEEEEDKKKKDAKFEPLSEFAKFVMMLKNVSVTYTQNEGTLLPGYDRNTQILGFDPSFNAPGIGFAFGHQDDQFAYEAARRGWLVENGFLNRQFNNTYAQQINVRANLEPIKYMRIELNATSNSTENSNGFFRFNENLQDYVLDSPVETGSYSVSTITLGTAFIKDGANNVSSIFEQFLDMRTIISTRLGLEHPNSNQMGDYYDGYSGTAQDVIIPAFIAAYSDKNADNVKLNALKQIPLPNWRITYDGLGKIPAFKKTFKSLAVNHAYRSSYSVNTYTSNLLYQEENGYASSRDINENFISQKQIGGINISEQFSPLINFDMKMQNDIQLKLEMKRNRTLNMSMSNLQLTENRSNDFIIGAGYIWKDLKLKLGGKPFKSDLNIRVDLSLRDNLTITRKVVENQNQITSGQNIISIKTAADYTLNQRLNLRFFYDQQLTDPKISTSFPTSNINAGIALRFTLSQ